MTDCFFDTETRSVVPIQRGNDLYTRSAECTIATWAIDKRPVECWDALDDPIIPTELEDALLDERVRKIAHVAKFDYNIVRHALGIRTPIRNWFCTQAQAYSHGLPGSLDLLGLVLGLKDDERKMAEGKDLIQFFCVPRDDPGTFNSPFDHPDKWSTFKHYAVRDTEALRECFWRMPTHNYAGANLRLWWLDMLVNERGFQFDAQLATRAVTFLLKAKAKHDMDMSTATGGIVTAATQRERLLKYLQQKLGLDLPNMRAAELRSMLESDDISPEARFLIETRIEGSKSSGSKYRTGLRTASTDGRIRQTLQFNGAGRTGRESGRGFQPHNMARPVLMVTRPSGKVELEPVKAKYIDEVIIPAIYSGAALDGRIAYGGPNEACALALRHAIVAAPGNELVVADWKNIESRVLAWIANEEWKLEAYRAADRGEGVDLYKLLFSQFFGTAIEDVNDTERQSGKVSELAFGFGGGVGALVTMAAGYQMDLTPLAGLVLPRASEVMLKRAEKAWRRAFLTNEDYLLEPAVYKACDVLKQTYRKANERINELKYDVDAAVKDAVETPGRAFAVARCKIWVNGTALLIELPSGRRLVYMNPQYHEEVIEDPDTGKPIRRSWISYCTARNRMWRREKAWAGLFIENIVQAIANDVLRIALLRVHEDTLRMPAIKAHLDTLPFEERTAISLHVHDEVVLDVPAGSYPLERLIATMVRESTWNIGLPLAADGWAGPRYGKR